MFKLLSQKLIRKARGDDGKPNSKAAKKKKTKATKAVEELEEEAASAPRHQRFRFPAEDVRWMVDMMDRHGDDFGAMARDPKNAFQLTPKQIRQRIVKFMSIPEQWAKHAKDRGLLDRVEDFKQ